MLKVLEDGRSCVSYGGMDIWIWNGRLDTVWCWWVDNVTAGKCDVSLALDTYASFSVGSSTF
jgi:hypothetical protein